VVSVVGHDAARTVLDEVAQGVFAPLLTRDFAAGAWLERWRSVASAYIDWQLDREAGGWQVDVAACEKAVQEFLALERGPEVTLHGRPDRVDRRDGASGAGAVTDYKTGSREALKRLLDDPTEDAQLVLYAKLVQRVSEVTYLPLGSDALDADGELKAVALSQPLLGVVMQGHLRRLSATLQRAADGEALAAIGDEAACRYCHARGVCRRDHRATMGTAGLSMESMDAASAASTPDA
jgi:ATP-dependent helicase/nuclease subunit B